MAISSSLVGCNLMLTATHGSPWKFILVVSLVSHSFWIHCYREFTLDKFIGKSKVCPKAKFFAWTAVLNRINTSLLLQIWRPKSVTSLDICVMCMSNSESFIRFLQCLIAFFFFVVWVV